MADNSWTAFSQMDPDGMHSTMGLTKADFGPGTIYLD
jgi:hypothetical protein